MISGEIPGGWIVRCDDARVLLQFADRLEASGAGPCEGRGAGVGQLLVDPDRGPLGNAEWDEGSCLSDGVGAIRLAAGDHLPPFARRFWRTVHAELADRGWLWDRLNPEGVFLEVDLGGPPRVTMTLGLDAERRIAWLVGGLPMHVPPHAALAVAVYLTKANWGLRVGSFDLDMEDGDAVFRIGVPVGDGFVCSSALASLIDAACWSIAEHGHGLRTVLQGHDPEDTIQEIERGAAGD